MDKFVTGYCPTLEEEYSIKITYLNASTLQNQSFIKDTFKCEHSIRTGCSMPHCPIYKSAPDDL